MADDPTSTLEGEALAQNTSNTPAFEPTILKEYLNKLLPLVLGAEEKDLEDSLWSSPENLEKLNRFANDSQVNALYITKSKEDKKEEEIIYHLNNVASVAIIKHSSNLDPNRPVQSQIQFLNLPGPSSSESGSTNVSPYEALHSCIHHAVAPYFDAYVNAKELELSLLHLQQNVEIPEISLNIHPVVQKAVEKSKQEGRRAHVDYIEPAYLSDTAFLNKLQGDVNGWIKEIQKVTKLSRDPASGTAMQEINFWLSMETALEGVDEQLKSDQIVHKYNQLMKDFPLGELLSAPDVAKIQEALNVVFAHFTKKMRLSPYPIKKALALVEAISRDLNDVLLKVLGSRRLMYMEYDEFEKVMAGAENVFKTWDEMIKEFTNVARDVMRKRSDKFIPIKINPAHDKLQERVTFVRNFRKQHEQLHQTIVKVMTQPKGTTKIVVEGENTVAQQEEGVSMNDINSMEEVKIAYESVKDIDVLDVSIEGTEIWMQAENAYNERVSRVENQIIASLRDRLGTCKNANEMFRVFSKFNALFVRPKIRGAIQEYQNELIDRVKKDISKLHEKFTQQYRKSEANHMAQLRDLPAISGAMIWARQIERQLQTYMKRVEDVLGKGWEMYAEGQKLQIESNNFKKKLDTRPIFEAWQTDISNRRDLNVTGRLFEITRNRAQGNILQLGVNFDPQIITLFKEVRNLLWLNHQVPHNISTSAKVAKRVYPFAVSLMETVRTYAQTVQKVQKHPDIIMLVASYRNGVQSMIAKGITFEWKYFVDTYDRNFRGALDSPENQHVTFVREFANTVSEFQDKVDDLIADYENISRLIEDLKTCAYQIKKFNSNLEKVQKLLDKRIETVLSQRLQHAITSWTTEFMSSNDDTMNTTEPTSHESSISKVLKNRRRTTRTDSIDGERPLTAKSEKPVLERSVHTVRIKNQVIYLDPPIEDARTKWYNQLHEWLCKIQGSRYDIDLQVRGSSVSRETTYSNLLAQIPDGSLEKAYEVIEAKLKEVSEYVNKWLQFQSLWDLEPNHIYDRLGDDLNKWKQILSEIKKSRTTFDNSEVERSFGFIAVNYEQAQTRVNAKYDQWQRDVLAKFGMKLGDCMKEFHADVSNSRKELENKSMESNNTSEAVALITFVQDLKRKVNKWSLDVEMFREGQKTLERQRYQFPSDWLHIEQIDDGLKLKIVAEDKNVEDKIKKIVAEWKTSKPIQGDIKPDIATNTLQIYEGRVTRLKDEYDMVCRAKEALDMALATEDSLDIVLEELKDLKSVWSSLSKVWQSINELKETLWSSVVPRKIRQQLDNLLNSIKEMPGRIRSYEAFNYVQETVKTYLKINPILSDLKSEALKERHWRQLFKALRVEGRFHLAEMSVGHVWDFDLKKNEQIIKDIVVQATGEMALEEFLKQVKETWTSYVLELVNYQNKCRLIKGWDELFTKCSENLNSLTAMKMSPYYKAFEEDASAWEDKLNRVHVLFDVWIDVQRQWVYLEGIFSGSADIKHLLPVETQRFSSINTEFLTVMKKVYKSPFVLDVLNIANVQKSLERLADLLSKIQKALGEYLERQRSTFPRFYFVGDEDLLEIIGNSKDVVRIQKHFKKMFAGVANIILNEDCSIILGMSSREGEEVPFKTPIKISDYSHAVNELSPFYLAEELVTKTFLEWIEKYPAQLVVVAVQIIWTQSVEKSLEQYGKDDEPLSGSLKYVLRALDVLADTVLQDLVSTQRKKCEHLITELVHQRDTIRQLQRDKISSPKDFAWLYHMRFYFNSNAEDPLSRLTIHMANAQFYYGYEYLGVPDLGAWGCFDEFNRLEERILSAVSQQVQTIQLGLKAVIDDPNAEVEIVGKSLKVNANTGIFITMNPGYAGRSNLPDNLKKLFRSMAMTKPDRELIAQVMLFSQGFRTAETLASKVVPLFNLCAEQLSPQAHYDFGLRALKSVLVSAGNLKRERLQVLRESNSDKSEYTRISEPTPEQEILIQSIRETIVPKLVSDDIPLLTRLYAPVDLDKLKAEIKNVCNEKCLLDGEMWLEKVLQLYQIQNIHHGLMMVGPSGSVLLQALERVEGREGVSYVIDPKAVSKDALYGNLDQTTREWTDGLFTHILRKIIDNVRGEKLKRHWIIFDGDVDPEWVENLNSVLDDNRLLTLPNGERLSLPNNVRIMFEVENLKYATLATVSRCGMEVVTLDMIYYNYLETLKSVPLDESEEEGASTHRVEGEETISPHLSTQRDIASILSKHMTEEGLVTRTLMEAEKLDHIMDFTYMRVLNTLFSLLNKTVRNVIEYNVQHPDFPMTAEHLDGYVTKRLVLGVIWSFSGDAKLDYRAVLGDFVRGIATVDLPPAQVGSTLIDYDVQISNGDWVSWTGKVPTIEIETHTVSEADVVVPTVDTVRHEEILYSWLSEHKPLLLCGPPGSGKTMTLFSALRKLPDMEVVGLNFSSATTPELILKTFEQYCEYRKTPTGVILSPIAIGRWIVVFCDEINLPAVDQYGTQRVISFLRQLIECGGYWRTSDKAWVKLERIQFVGACNPPTDPGRVPLTHRYLRHAPLVMVDYPGEISLNQIYGTFARAMLKVVPSLRAYAEPLTAAMVEFYLKSQKHFTPDMQAHYIYSPRELTRWMRGIFEAIKPLESLSLEGLIRIWAHEALRLFQDRLVTEEERKWTDDNIDATAMKHFPNLNSSEALTRPILFSNWLSKHYIPVEREELRDYVKARLKVFYEEELDVPLVLFNDVLDHVLRIDRVFRQMQGHLLLIGVSGSGKTTLSRFVAWMNGLSVFQIKAHNKYTGDDFDEDLRTVLRRAGCKGEKICFVMDESNVLDSGFLERMNTLLANAEVPGLFEGDEYNALMTSCKEGAQRDGLMLDSPEELYKWFTQQVMKNLHVVFTMNPPEGGLASRAATSPALFNRCVLDWFGDWSDQAFFQVGMEFTQNLDLDLQTYTPPINFPTAYRLLPPQPSHRSAVVNAFVFVHQSLYEINAKLSKRQGRYNYVTPRHYLDFINHYVRLFNEKREDLEEQQRHLNIGLDKLRETVTTVDQLRSDLDIKNAALKEKEREANAKFQKLVADQSEAEERKKASVELSKALDIQTKQIEERREVVMNDLAQAEPAVEDAKRSVRGITRQHLTEVRSMNNPPEAVKMAMTSVCLLLGRRADSWQQLQGIIRSDDFINSIVQYDTNKLTKHVREKINSEYISKPTYNFDVVNRASKACGPLVKWVIAQVSYSGILDRVGPMRKEMEDLKEEQKKTQQQAESLQQMIKDLENKIAVYKEEYAELIKAKEAIKDDMSQVKNKVERSMTLLESLSSEKERWVSGSQAFETQMGTIVGDVLLSAAFLAYGGYFDQQYREILLQKWTNHLVDAKIQYKPELSLTEYLSTADDRLSWQANSLPADDLCTENAIMLKRFNRYPLIIDPSGQASSFLKNEFKNKKITITSFLDDSFIKNLESALRFGNPLLIQDVEHLDPILNPVLNKELRRTGGRVLIRLGGQDIDFSPSFTLFLSTRDPSVNFPPDVCSRVTFVNFTVTRSSLQSQCLNQVLKVERPDTDQKRTDLVKLQGEFKLRLRHLEKSLLQALNESKGNILDDTKILGTLEKLKQEAAEITRKVEETDTIMQEVERVTAQYTPLAQACSSVFFVMEQINILHHFYQFSLEYFYEIFQFILHENPNLSNVTDVDERLRIIIRDLFKVTFKRVSRALLNEDYVTFAILLAQIKLRGSPGQVDESEYDFMLSGGDVVPGSRVTARELGLPDNVFDSDQLCKIKEFTALQCFNRLSRHISDNIDEWVKFMNHDSPENHIPDWWDSSLPVSEFVSIAFEPGFASQTELDFKALVLNEVQPTTPISLCSVPGYDASYRVDNLVSDVGVKCTSVAMGSQEGFNLADNAIANAVKNGNWVLLKNVHLATSWLERLRYAPLGWTKIYEFNDSDQDFAINTIDAWLNSVAQNRENISPDKIPWEALRTLICVAGYGGRIDNEFDKLIPDGTKMEDFVNWIDNLPEREPPIWLGLPSNAERVLATSKGRKMKNTADDDVVELSQESDSQSSSQPAWMRALQASVEGWLEVLPSKIPMMNRTSESIKNPLFRFFDRENSIGLLKTVSINHWIADFRSRLQQLENITKLHDFLDLQVWIGGLFMPEAFITATRQAVAQKHKWSLEELVLEISLNKSGDPDSFALTGNGNHVSLCGVPTTKLDISQIKWVRKTEATPVTETTINLPVYLNEDRSDLLFIVNIEANASEKVKIVQ
ncbi:5969_t:CDS:10, partial [Racocetra fulgida]